MDNFKEIIKNIETIRKNKENIIKITNNFAFRKSFYNLFSVGDFSSPNIKFSDDNYLVSMRPVHPSKWRIEFYIKSHDDAADQELWRKADIHEIILCWDKYYPLLKKALQTDSENIERVNKIINMLVDELAPEMMVEYLDYECKV